MNCTPLTRKRRQGDDRCRIDELTAALIQVLLKQTTEGDGRVFELYLVIGLLVAQAFDEGASGNQASSFSERRVGYRSLIGQLVRARIETGILVVWLETLLVEKQPPDSR